MAFVPGFSEGIAERHSVIEPLLALGRDAPWSTPWGVIEAPDSLLQTRSSVGSRNATRLPQTGPFAPATLPWRRPHRTNGLSW